MTKQKRLTIRVALNGTDENPWHKMCLTQNPIPQLGKYEYDAACLQLQKLGGDPIPDEYYIRDVLKGFSPEFILLCIQQFRRGEYVEFEVTFPE